MKFNDNKGTCLLQDKGSTPAWLQVFHMLCKPMKWNHEHVLHRNILDEQQFDIWKKKKSTMTFMQQQYIHIIW